MYKLLFAWSLCVCVASGAFAESQAARLSRAHGLLQQNDAAAALELLRELQVESPGDERVLYALGCAQYKMAEAQGGAAGAPAGAAASFKEAQASFDALSRAKDPNIARQAAFDRANCLAQAAKQAMANPQQAAAAADSLRGAVSAYEDFLRHYPDDKGAQQNLDHVRFLLKKMLRENKDQNKDQKQDKPKDQKQQEAVLSVRNAQTEIPGATAVVGEDSTVKLVAPGNAGAPQ